MGLIINSEISKQFLLEEDAIKGFKKAVDNNQTLLAMRVLSEILDTFVEAFYLMFEDSIDETEEKITTEDIENSEDVQVDQIDLVEQAVIKESKPKIKKDKN